MSPREIAKSRFVLSRKRASSSSREFVAADFYGEITQKTASLSLSLVAYLVEMCSRPRQINRTAIRCRRSRAQEDSHSRNEVKIARPQRRARAGFHLCINNRPPCHPTFVSGGSASRARHVYARIQRAGRSFFSELHSDVTSTHAGNARIITRRRHRIIIALCGVLAHTVRIYFYATAKRVRPRDQRFLAFSWRKRARKTLPPPRVSVCFPNRRLTKEKPGGFCPSLSERQLALVLV